MRILQLIGLRRIGAQLAAAAPNPPALPDMARRTHSRANPRQRGRMLLDVARDGNDGEGLLPSTNGKEGPPWRPFLFIHLHRTAGSAGGC
jgi:hypothetical protein